MSLVLPIQMAGHRWVPCKKINEQREAGLFTKISTGLWIVIMSELREEPCNLSLRVLFRALVPEIFSARSLDDVMASMK
jgi:hypothetical protein